MFSNKNHTTGILDNITEDDICVDDSFNKSSDITSLTLDEIYEIAKLEYTQTILVDYNFDTVAEIKRNYTDENEEDKTISQLSKRLSQLLDLYEIKHSPLYYTKGLSSENCSVEIKQKNGYISIINNNEDFFHDWYLIMHINRIKFSNLKQMVNFIYTVSNILSAFVSPRRKNIFRCITINNSVINIDLTKHSGEHPCKYITLMNRREEDNLVIKYLKHRKRLSLLKSKLTFYYLTDLYSYIGYFFSDETKEIFIEEIKKHTVVDNCMMIYFKDI